MNALLEKAQTWLNEIGIKTNVCSPPSHLAGCLMVNCEDMKLLGSEQLPQVAYDFILKELRSSIGTNKFYWTQCDGVWAWLDTF